MGSEHMNVVMEKNERARTADGKPVPFLCCMCELLACYGFDGRWFCMNHYVERCAHLANERALGQREQKQAENAATALAWNAGD